MTPLTDATARLPVSPTAVARQWVLSLSDPQAGRSLDAFLKSPLGKRLEKR